MAKNTTKIIEIDGREYTLHSTKSSGDNKSIGSVPVLSSTDIADFVDVYDEKFIIGCLRSGIAVALQAKARRACSSDKITQSDFDRIASELLSEDAARYAGNFGQLKIDVDAVFENESANTEHQSDKVWTEYKNG